VTAALVTVPKELQVRVTPEMIRYSYAQYALYFLSALVHPLALIGLLKWGFSARVRDLAERYGRNGLVRAYVYYPLFMLAYSALCLPVTFVSRFWLPKQYGLATQSLGGWAADAGKAFLISAAVGPPVVALLYWTLRRSPRRWWLGFWLASIPLVVIATLLQPLVIDPLFNRYEPLKDPKLRDQILALASRAGIEHGRVLEVDASRRTKEVNAYVTGIGGSARIVLWDNLLTRLDRDEVLFVMAHEMGHYVEAHVPIGIAAAILGSFGVLWGTDALSRLLLARWGPAWGIRGLDDLASLPLLLLVLYVINFLGSPVSSGISRIIERRADDFALRITRNPRAGATSYIKLSEMNLSLPNPPPLFVFWAYSHPPLQARIERALEWEERHPTPPEPPR
jgi:STE24 endopeptidase